MLTKYLWVFLVSMVPLVEPVHGQEHWRPVFWTWILNQQLSPSCSGFCLQELL